MVLVNGVAYDRFLFGAVLLPLADTLSLAQEILVEELQVPLDAEVVFEVGGPEKACVRKDAQSEEIEDVVLNEMSLWTDGP